MHIDTSIDMEYYLPYSSIYNYIYVIHSYLTLPQTIHELDILNSSHLLTWQIHMLGLKELID